MLAYDVDGDGRAILLLHEGIADRHMWEPQVAPFVAAGFRVVRCDLPGFGESAVEPGPISNIGDLRELLDHLGIDRAILVGGSYGARVALEYALTHPDQVEKLVLMGPGMRDTEWSEEIRQFGAREEELLEAGDLDAATELNVLTWLVGPRRSPEDVDPSVLERVREMQRRLFEADLAVEGDIGPDEPLDPPASARLGEVRCPVLVVVGDLDQPDILRQAEKLVEGIPGARKTVIAGTAHVPSMEKPVEFNRLVLDFLAAA
jgi:pimeloyl-ACP methyl ester carboxylesterase